MDPSVVILPRVRTRLAPPPPHHYPSHRQDTPVCRRLWDLARQVRFVLWVPSVKTFSSFSRLQLAASHGTVAHHACATIVVRALSALQRLAWVRYQAGPTTDLGRASVSIGPLASVSAGPVAGRFCQVSWATMLLSA
jgi:hypothetical protein